MPAGRPETAVSLIGALRRFEALDHASQDAAHGSLIDTHQDRVFKCILQHLREFCMIFRQHLELVAAGQRAAVVSGPNGRWFGDHFGASGSVAFDPPVFCSGPLALASFGLVVREAALKMNLPRSCSRLTEDCVIAMVPPGGMSCASPPGLRFRNLPPKRLSLVISAELSLGKWILSFTDKVTSARN